jgi:hypothetical protein
VCDKCTKHAAASVKHFLCRACGHSLCDNRRAIDAELVREKTKRVRQVRARVGVILSLLSHNDLSQIDTVGVGL